MMMMVMFACLANKGHQYICTMTPYIFMRITPPSALGSVLFHITARVDCLGSKASPCFNAPVSVEFAYGLITYSAASPFEGLSALRSEVDSQPGVGI